MDGLSITLKAKQTTWSKVLFKTMFLLVRMRLLSLESSVAIVNKALSYGAFKFKVGNGKWRKLDIDGKFVIEE